MDIWTAFWGIFIIAGLALFAAISVWVSVGGFFDLKQLFRDLGADSKPPADNEP